MENKEKLLETINIPLKRRYKITSQEELLESMNRLQKGQHEINSKEELFEIIIRLQRTKSKEDSLETIRSFRRSLSKNLNHEALLEIINSPIRRRHNQLHPLQQSTRMENEAINNNSFGPSDSFIHKRIPGNSVKNSLDSLHCTTDFNNNKVACERLIEIITATRNLLTDVKKETFEQQFIYHSKVVERARLLVNELQFQTSNEIFESSRRAYWKSKSYELGSLERVCYIKGCDAIRKYDIKFSSVYREACRAIANCREYTNIGIDIILQREDGTKEVRYVCDSYPKTRPQVKNFIGPITPEDSQNCTEETESRDGSKNRETQQKNHTSVSSKVKTYLPRKNKEQNHKPIETWTKTSDTSTYFNEKVALDLLGPLPKTDQGNRFILIVQDCFAKFTRAYALPNQDTWLIRDTLLNSYFLVFGFPLRILTEKNNSFSCISFIDLQKNFGIEGAICNTYNRKDMDNPGYRCAAFREYLELNNREKDWDNNLWMFSINYNTTPHTSTGYSPIELLYSKPTEAIDECKNDCRINKDCLIDLHERLAELQARAKGNLIGAE